MDSKAGMNYLRSMKFMKRKEEERHVMSLKKQQHSVVQQNRKEPLNTHSDESVNSETVRCINSTNATQANVFYDISFPTALYRAGRRKFNQNEFPELNVMNQQTEPSKMEAGSSVTSRKRRYK